MRRHDVLTPVNTAPRDAPEGGISRPPCPDGGGGPAPSAVLGVGRGTSDGPNDPARDRPGGAA